MMLEELNSEGMCAIDLNHKLSLRLLDKVWFCLSGGCIHHSCKCAYFPIRPR